MSLRKILVVDDEVKVQTLLSTLLSDLPETLVATAGSVSQARESMLDTEFDLIITDVKIPDLNGIEWLRELSQSDTSPPVIVLTGYGSIDQAVAAIKLGAVEYLTKPIDNHALVKIVERTLQDSRHAEDATVSSARTVSPSEERLRPASSGTSARQQTPSKVKTQFRDRKTSMPESPDLGQIEALGTYRLLDEIGAGAMARMYKALDCALNRTVAVKVLKPELARDSGLVARFLREGQALAKVGHTNVVQVYAAGTDRGLNYIAMEFVEGSDLWDFVTDNGPLSVVDALDTIKQAAMGLQSALAQDIVHRDIKPENLLRTLEGLVKVTDFGVAKMLESTEALTQHAEILGTADYIAPEQARGETIDHRADQYGLGATLYFLLTGEVPFPGDDPFVIMQLHISEPVPRIPEIPEIVNSLISRLMAKQPKDRWSNYGMLIKFMDHIQGQLANDRP